MRLVLIILLLPACTEPNPGYEGERDSGVPCEPGDRTCSGQSAMVCVPKGSGAAAYQLDRTCPPTSTCKAGLCVPGAGACTGPASCGDGMVCTVFVNPSSPTTLGTFCAKPVGAKAGNAPCATPAECASGHCPNVKGKVMLCYQACTKESGCPPPLKCGEVTLTVNGVPGKVQGCGL